MSSTLYLLTHSLDYLLELIAGIVLLCTWRSRPDRSRLFLGGFFICSILGSLINISLMLFFSPNNWQSILYPTSILTGFPIFFLLMLYLFECIRPGYITFRRGLTLFLPWIILGVLNTIVCSICFTPITSVSDLPNHWNCPDVWVRMLTIGMYLPYAYWLIRMPNRRKRSDISRPLVRSMCWITAAMTLTFIGAHGLHIAWMDVAHLILYIAITLLSLYSEFYDRLSPTRTPEGDFSMAKEEEENEKEEDPEPLPEDIIQEVEKRVRHMMEEEELWREPELKLDDFVRRVGTNRVYLTHAIQRIGYEGYKDYVTHMRVQYMCEQLRRPDHDSIQTICYDAGFRSRGSAWRNFAAIVGCSPQEYAQKK